MHHRLATVLLLLGALLLAGASGIIIGANRGAGALVPPQPTAVAFATSVPLPSLTRTPAFERPATPGPPTTTAVSVVGPNALAPDKLKLTTTFASIGIELPFGGDDNGNATAELEFKPAGETAWRKGLPLWPITGDVPAPGHAFYGSALLLDAGTKYDLRVTVADPDGLAGANVVTGTATTRAENIAQASSLTPTHYVSPTGDDKATGTAAAPWRTLDGALIAAPGGRDRAGRARFLCPADNRAQDADHPRRGPTGGRRQPRADTRAAQHYRAADLLSTRRHRRCGHRRALDTRWR